MCAGYDGDYKVKTFSCWNQFLCMAFGQLTYREGLRDVETCLGSRQDQLYHLGIRGEVSHSTLADANRERDGRIYYDLAPQLIRRARALYKNEPNGLELKETVYALDSTTIDLCWNLFPWARFRRTKGAIKLHPLLNLRGSIPAFISISQGKKDDMRILDELVLEPGPIHDPGGDPRRTRRGKRRAGRGVVPVRAETASAALRCARDIL